jgi:iron complex outermembrane receptor protein
VIDTVFDLDSPFNQAYIPNRGAVGGGGVLSPDLGTGLDVNGFQAVGLQICGGFVCTPGATPSSAADIAATRAQMGAVPFDDPRIAKQTALSPDTRYTFTFFGGYDLTPHAHLYTSVLLNQRDSAQTGVSQFFTVVDNGNVFNQALGANPSLSALVGGPANGFGFAEPVIAQVLTNTQTVNYGRFVVGVKGDLPNFGTLTDWTYDVYGQYARSDGSYTTQYVRSDRVNATSFADTPSGCDTSAVNPFFGGPSMDAAEPGVACVPVNYIAAVQNGQFTPAEFNFLYNTEKGHTTYDHMYVEGSATGNVFNLPAGPLAAAVGFQLRRESLNDTPGADFINQNVYNETTSGITKGSESVEEVFGELQIPILKDLPFIQSLNANVSGRFSNYSSYGGNFTYKGTVDWRVNDWLAVRGTYGTAFRAPALFELFLADQTGFLNQIGLDPCINYATSGVSPIIQKNCAAQGIPGNYNGATAGTSSALIATGGGAGHLKAETSDAETIGIVLTPKLWGQTINVAVDYYDYDIDNQINQFGAANILDQCYEAADFPANPFCSLFTRNTTNPTAGLDNITLVNNDFVNIAKEIDQGLDVDLHYATDLPDRYKLTIEGNLAWTFYTSTDLLGGTVNNFLGSIGNPTFDGNVDFKLDHGPWTFNYLLFMIGASSDNAFTPTTLTDFRGTGETVNSNYSVPFYTTSTISVRRKFDKFTIEAGVKNLFNQAPPNISVSDNIEFREGTVTQAVSQYDLIGRSFYFDIDAKF